MSVVLIFLALVASIAGWWLSRQGLTSKPWRESVGPHPNNVFPQPPPHRMGVTIFLAVIGGLFAMLGSAFVMQIDETPWLLVPMPAQVWINTGFLATSSLCLHMAARGRQKDIQIWLAAGSATAVGFMVGQLDAWETLTRNGYELSGAPAASFFYLITGLHGLHILGGLIALAMVWIRRSQSYNFQNSIGLCALYWHGLLVIWLLLLALLMGLGNEFLALCRSALT